MQVISRKMPEQALGGMPLSLRLVKEINLQNFHAGDHFIVKLVYVGPFCTQAI